MYMLDSCICIDIMRGQLPIAWDLMRKSDPKQFKVPSIVVAELEFGIENSANPREARLLTESFLSPFEVAPFDETCSRAYGVLRKQLRDNGTPIGPNDMLIAATAIANQAILVSNNVKEFKRVPGLRLESWREIDV